MSSLGSTPPRSSSHFYAAREETDVSQLGLKYMACVQVDPHKIWDLIHLSLPRIKIGEREREKEKKKER